MITNEDKGHCSNHTYHANGCSDCTTAESLREEYANQSRLMKAERVHLHALEILPSSPGPKLQMVRQQTIAKVAIFLSNASADVIKAVKNKYAEIHKSSDSFQLLEVAISAISWIELFDSIHTDLEEAVQSGGIDGVHQLDLSVEDNKDEIIKLASVYSTKRAAEMIGKKVVDGKFVDNSTARFVVSDTTKDDLKDIITSSLQDNLSLDEIVTNIRDSGVFSLRRADLIARTEVAMAQVHGHMDVWKKSEMIKTVDLVISTRHDFSDICDEVKKSGPYSIDSVPLVPLHPRCECGIEVIELA